MKILNKTINFFGTASVSENENMFNLVTIALKALTQKPVDMLVFDFNKTNDVEIRSAGYDLETQTKLDEKTIIITSKNKKLITKKLWLKIDDYGDKFIATFLYPSEY